CFLTVTVCLQNNKKYRNSLVFAVICCSVLEFYWGIEGLMVNAASPMFEMSNVLPPHNLHFARPGSSSVLTHDMYFSICSQAWLNLHFPDIIPSASLSYCCYG